MMTNALRLSIGVAISASLIGCNKAEPAAANTTGVAVANAPAPAAPPAAPPAAATGDALTADFMVGKWSARNESCADTLEFHKDGKMTTPFGDAKWALDGDKLNADFGDGQKQHPSTIKVLTHDRIEIMRDDGKTETQKRC